MLNNLDYESDLKKKDYSELKDKYEVILGSLQRRANELKVPIMIVFEGYGASGKGQQISEIISGLDPRGFKVHTVKNETVEDSRYPYMMRFFNKLPQYGNIAIYDSSWYRKVLNERFDKNITKDDCEIYYNAIKNFEKQLTDDRMIIVKFFLSITKEEQKKRFDELLSNDLTKWRVSKADLERNDKFDKYTNIISDMLERTNFDYAPWHIVEANNKRYASAKIYQTLAEQIEIGLNNFERRNATKNMVTVSLPVILEKSPLLEIDLSKALEKKEYKEKLQILQARIKELQNELYIRKIPVVIVMEGQDAAGKGGAIKRLTEKMDPRGYDVNTTAKPTHEEYQYHYLWRFYNKLPKTGHIAIFDRTWYGRVLVERIEGFATGNEWRRAYKEINDFEKDLVDQGVLIIKFFIQIDKDEQEVRFKARMENPLKQWKITDEDWRNREKWDLYDKAISEMLIRTSTNYAKWTIVEGNNKYYARIKVLEKVIKEIENRIGE